jgi:hypothetical protein
VKGRFMAKVSPTPDQNGCVRWMGAMRGASGYGSFIVRGKNLNAHRAAWEVYHGAPAPEGLVVRHTCDNRWCVAEAHLVLGTSRDNTQDILARGRWGFPKAVGVRHHKAKLTESQVVAIRSTEGLRNQDIAAQYGVSTSAIAHIRARHNWRHLAEETR